MRDLQRQNESDNPSAVGRVPRALNGKDTTWEDLKALGVDPWTDPLWVDKYTAVVTHGMQGLDTKGAIERKLAKQF